MIPILAWRALNAAIADATLNRSSSRLSTCGPVIWNPPMMLVEYAEATRGARGACQAPTPFWRLGCYRATSQPAAGFQGPLRSTQRLFPDGDPLLLMEGIFIGLPDSGGHSSMPLGCRAARR